MHNNYDNMLLVGQKAQWNRKWCRQTTSTWSVTQEKGNTATQYGVRKGWASPTCCWIHGAPKRKHGLSIPPSHQITVSSDSRHHRQNSNTPRRKRRRKSYWFGDEQIFLKQDTKMKKKNKWAYVKMKSFLSSKNTIRQMKRRVMSRENIQDLSLHPSTQSKPYFFLKF